METTTENGSTKSSSIQSVPGNANPGQYQRGYQAPELSARARLRGRTLTRRRGREAGWSGTVECLPRVVPELIYRGCELLLEVPGVEVALAHDRIRQPREHVGFSVVALGRGERRRIRLSLRWLVSVPREVQHRVLVCHHPVEEVVRQDRVLRVGRNSDRVVEDGALAVRREPVAERLPRLHVLYRRVLPGSHYVSRPGLMDIEGSLRDADVNAVDAGAHVDR